MKILKSILTAAAFMGVLSFSTTSFANPIDKPNTLNAQIQSYLETLDLSSLDAPLTINVDIMVNARGELMVISTDNKDFDAAIKAKLNYKKVSSGNLKLFHQYTIPVSFRN